MSVMMTRDVIIIMTMGLMTLVMMTMDVIIIMTLGPMALVMMTMDVIIIMTMGLMTLVCINSPLAPHAAEIKLPRCHKHPESQ